MNASDRGKLLLKLADLIEQEIDKLAIIESLDNGKPLSLSKVDLTLSLEYLRYFGQYADKVHGKTIPANGSVFAYTRLEPYGVCGLIIPWNFPFLMAIWKIAPALSVGNTVVLKPSEITPLSALHLGQLIVKARFPKGVVNIVPGYGLKAGAALIKHPDIYKIAFTGSTMVGKKIMEEVGACGIKKLSLELGGKSPLVICEDANIDLAVQIAQKCVFANQGQCCCAPSRTFVHESIYDEFVKKSKELAECRVLGNPFAETTEQGPQVNKSQFDKIMSLIESGKQEGAKLECGGERFGNKGYFIKPTVFSNVTDNMRIAKEEIFGPVQQILKYSTLEEVIERANETTYGLAAGIITQDLNKVNLFTQAVNAGTVWVNTYLHFAPQLPFGGYKMSGIGRENGAEVLKEYCQVKTVCNYLKILIND